MEYARCDCAHVFDFREFLVREAPIPFINTYHDKLGPII